MNCQCGRAVKDATLCQTCTGRLTATLRQAVDLGDELDISLSRQAVTTDRGLTRIRGANTTQALAFDLTASEAAWILRDTLAAWVREFDGQPARPDIPHMAAWLMHRVGTIRQHTDAAACLTELDAAVAQATRAIDRPAERRYAGPCGQCARPLYVRPDRKTVTCHDHEPPWTAEVETQRSMMLGKAADQLAPAASAIRMLAVLGLRATPVQITRWQQAGRLIARGTDRDGRRLYRLGDLADLAVTATGSQATRLPSRVPSQEPSRPKQPSGTSPTRQPHPAARASPPLPADHPSYPRGDTPPRDRARVGDPAQ